MSGAHGQRRRFAWADTRRELAAFAHEVPGAIADPAGRTFSAAGASLRLPGLAPAAAPGETPRDYLARVEQLPTRHVVVLLRAGAMAAGYWEGPELLRHKAQKRYVVRGKGHAQTLHLKTKGKSRYGSRLRLQNWERLLTDLTTRLVGWWDELGAPDQVHYGCPVRVWAELFAVADPAPPFVAADPLLRRLPLHVHEPDHTELLRVHRVLAHGHVERPLG